MAVYIVFDAFHYSENEKNRRIKINSYNVVDLIKTMWYNKT